jgi:hypothetical protein
MTLTARLYLVAKVKSPSIPLKLCKKHTAEPKKLKINQRPSEKAVFFSPALPLVHLWTNLVRASARTILSKTTTPQTIKQIRAESAHQFYGLFLTPPFKSK